MSHNRDIKTLQAMTGLKYSYIRKRLKANKWDYMLTFKELQFNMAYRFEKLSAAIHDNMKAAFEAQAASINDFVKSLDNLKETIGKGEV